MKAQWTIMVYMAGFNDLSPFATKDLNEMRTVGSSDQVKLTAFLKQLSEKSAYQVVVGKDGKGEVKKRIAGADSGSPQTLIDYVRWAVKKAPAEKYGLIVWNHGSGWQPDDLADLYEAVRSARGAEPVSPRELGVRSTQTFARSLFDRTVVEVLSQATAGERAIASDDGTGHSLDTIELNNVLAKAHEELGRPLEFLGMDACLMSALEVAYETQAHARHITASEELEPGDGWPYNKILADLAADPEMDGSALGKRVVERYIAYYRNRETDWPVTMCALDTGQTGKFVATLDGLASSLIGNLKDEGDAAKVLRAHSRSARFTGDLVDLKSFCTNLGEGSAAAPVKAAARKVVTALKPGGFVIAEDHLGPKVESCGGVTAYLPQPSESISKYYKDLTFAKDHKWDDFLLSYQRALTGD